MVVPARRAATASARGLAGNTVVVRKARIDYPPIRKFHVARRHDPCRERDDSVKER